MSKFQTPLLPLAASMLAASFAPSALAAATPVAASTTASAPSLTGELLGIVLPLALIILVLLAILYAARRRFGLTGQDAPLSVLQILPVGPRERVVLIKTRSGRVFTVGVTGQSVNLITDLRPSDLQFPHDSAPAGASPVIQDESLRSNPTAVVTRQPG